MARFCPTRVVCKKTHKNIGEQLRIPHPLSELQQFVSLSHTDEEVIVVFP